MRESSRGSEGEERGRRWGVTYTLVVVEDSLHHAPEKSSGSASGLLGKIIGQVTVRLEARVEH